jgi:hypothetical protein
VRLTVSSWDHEGRAKPVYSVRGCNTVVYLIFPIPRYSITNLSRPIPPPALNIVSYQHVEVLLRHGSIFESINIVLQSSRDFYTMRLDAFLKEVRIMHSLSPRNDLFSTTEHVI